MIQTLGLKGGVVKGWVRILFVDIFPGMGKDFLDEVSLSSVCTPMYN